MKSLKIFITLFILNCTLFIGTANAQWWTQGGKLIWPYGNVEIPKGNLIVPHGVIAHEVGWDFEHQRLAIDGVNYNLVYWVDGTNGNNNNDGKTLATAYKTLDKVAEILPKDLEGRDAFICLPAGSEITFTKEVIFNFKNGAVVFTWCGAWLDSVSSSDADLRGLWLNPDSLQLIGNSDQVVFNVGSYHLRLNGDQTARYYFDSFDYRIPYGATNSYRHYWNRFVFKSDIPNSNELLTVYGCQFTNTGAWGMEIDMKNVQYTGCAFNRIYGGYLNGLKIVGDSTFNAINDWKGAVAFCDLKADFVIDRAWEPSGYYHPDYSYTEYYNWDVIDMGERQLFAFEGTNYCNFNFWWMKYTKQEIPETGLPYMWINWYSLYYNTIIYLSSAIVVGTDRCQNPHTLLDKSIDKPYQWLNKNLIQDADTLKAAKYMNLQAIPSDSTGLQKGMLYYNSSTGAIHRKF